ncbi:FAD-dependent oxidoreductase [Nannocystis punicea]|uniref:FAD-dependent oxidoreductase n=1 Tax=Nannocystis punicea TaxID=2995304 RepID=A0ABY7H872_9BACT|nr:FAD-dependent oxidoreductase [Nannocystis poenicansa]WAS95475.1 FAD-dependent oxidoreductase [Nannocystis poenicansa]
MLGISRRPANTPDRRAPVALPRPLDVLVVGGGIAGLAAATILAERGARVTVLEPETYLGGRAGAWTDTLADGTEFEMERGFHAFFRQYYNLREWLRRIDPELGFLRPVEDYPLLGPDGLRESFAGLPKLPIWNLVSLIRRSSTMTWRDALRVDDTCGRAIMAYDPLATYAQFDREDARSFLDRLGFPPRARQMLFDVFAHSFFNPEQEFSAAELLMMFHFYFVGNPEGIVFDVARGPFSTTLWRPMAAVLERRGVRLRLAEAAVNFDRGPDGRHRVTSSRGQVYHADACILAASVPGLQQLVAESPHLGYPRGVAPEDPCIGHCWREQVAAQTVTARFAVWRLWLDRPPAPGRAAFVGTTGLGLVDNISLYPLFEDESRDWAARSGGSVVELHAYALPDELDEAEIKADLLRALHDLYPETRDAATLDERFLLSQDCPAFRPGTHPLRLRVDTPDPTLYLAGDCIHTPFPTALMERAASTGILAANHILHHHGAAEEPLWSVPPRGPLARLIHRKALRDRG